MKTLILIMTALLVISIGITLITAKAKNLKVWIALNSLDIDLERFNVTPLTARSLSRQFVLIYSYELNRRQKKEFVRLLEVFNNKFFAPRHWHVSINQSGILSIITQH